MVGSGVVEGWKGGAGVRTVGKGTRLGGSECIGLDRCVFWWPACGLAQPSRSADAGVGGLHTHEARQTIGHTQWLRSNRMGHSPLDRYWSMEGVGPQSFPGHAICLGAVR